MMKKYYLLFLLLTLFVRSDAQTIPDSLFGTNSIFTGDVSTGTETFVKFLVQPDGLILGAGYDYDGNLNAFLIDIMRFDVCGAVDSSFGAGGYVRHTFEQRNTGYDFTLQPDGKILSVGLQAPSNAGSQQIPYVARFNADGSVDTVFGTSGSNSLRFDNVSSGNFRSVHLLPDGRVLCIGRSSGNINGGMNAVGVMRFDSNGDLDLSFNGTGKIQHVGFPANPEKVMGYLMQNGDVIALGGFYDASFNEHFFAIAFDSTGAQIMSFGNSGSYIDSLNLTQKIFTSKQADEKILMVGERTPSGDGMEIIRLNTNGQLDAQFGNGGHVNLVVPSMIPSGIKQMQNGQIMVMGGFSSGFGIGCGVVLNSDGTVDSTFGNNGFTFFDVSNNSGTHSVDDLIEIAGDRFLAGGGYPYFYFRRFLPSSNVPHVTYMHPFLTATGTGTYQWYLDSILIPGAAASTYDPSLDGSYTVLLTDDLGCTYMSDPYVISSVGLNEVDTDLISVFPVPFKEKLVLETKGMKGKLIINIEDVSGKVIYNAIHEAGEKFEVNTSQFVGGVYIVSVISADDLCVVKVLK
jgi:uncharacterized delta-60 repeat protein